MGILAISGDGPRGSREDFLICESRVEELVKAAQAMADPDGSASLTGIGGGDERVVLLATLRDLVAACDDSGAILRGKFGALLDDVDEWLRSKLAAAERLPNRTPPRSRAFRSARRWLDG